jgi:hypothetical protein
LQFFSSFVRCPTRDGLYYYFQARNLFLELPIRRLNPLRDGGIPAEEANRICDIYTLGVNLLFSSHKNHGDIIYTKSVQMMRLPFFDEPALVLALKDFV